MPRFLVPYRQLRHLVVACFPFLCTVALHTGGANAQPFTVPLNSGWSFRQADNDPWLLAQVPGEVHTDLLRNGKIPDPYREFNADSVQWIEKRDWTYRCMILADPVLMGHEQVDLVFKGLDTFAEVWLNGFLVGKADNMFRKWEWPIRKLLRPGANTLTVVFRSAVQEGGKLRTAYGVPLPHDNDPSGASPFVRKAAYQFGWDFAPRLVGCGIWQAVELRCWNKARITGVQMRQHFTTDSIRLAFAVHTVSQAHATIHCFVGDTHTSIPVNGRGPTANTTFHLTLPRKALWWPNGSGRQILHQLRIVLRDARGKLQDTREHLVGLRTVALLQQPDSIGRSFTFVVNGESIFMKGCNIVPPDMFPSRTGNAGWIALVRAMQKAHMNMVRVWAGGIYPPEAFYQACDTAGILVWQDAMFANMLPAEGAFLENITQEVKEQAERFAMHPCAALLCGNNELDVAWNNWGWQSKYGLHGADSARVIDSNRSLWLTRLASIAEQNGLPYTGTSPLSNWGNAAGLRSGDLHYWGVWHGDADFASFGLNTGRFVSEYGFQSWPDSTLLARYIQPDELRIGSPAMQNRQRSYKGDFPIWQAIQHELNEEPRTLCGFIAASQQVQAMAYARAIGAHLKNQPWCMGTLFWQLNDCWPGPSWSLIDVDGNWKPGMYIVENMYRANTR